MKVDKKLVLVAVAAFALAWFVLHNEGGGIIPNPFAPQRPNRPVLTFIIKAAKTFLWVAMFAEPKPQHVHHVVQAVGPDGTEYLEHGDL